MTHSQTQFLIVHYSAIIFNRTSKGSQRLTKRHFSLCPPPETNSQAGVDPIYQLLKQAGDLGGGPKKDRGDKDYSLSPREHGSNSSSLTSLQHQRWTRSNASSSASSSSSYLLTVSSSQGDHASTSGEQALSSYRNLKVIFNHDL